MKYINIKAQPKEGLPENNCTFFRRVVDDSTGSKSIRVSFGYMEPVAENEIHVHNAWEQLLIVLKGALRVKNGQGEFKVKAGEAIFIYPGEKHTCYTRSEPTEYICITGLNLPPKELEAPPKQWK